MSYVTGVDAGFGYYVPDLILWTFSTLLAIPNWLILVGVRAAAAPPVLPGRSILIYHRAGDADAPLVVGLRTLLNALVPIPEEAAVSGPALAAGASLEDRGGV